MANCRGNLGSKGGAVANNIVDSNTLCYSNDAGGSGTNTSYVKVKDVDVALAGTYRVSFELTTDAGAVYGRIYINGVAIGTEFNTGAGSYYTFTQDFTVNAGDNIQLYVKGSSGGTVSHYWRHFRLYSTLFTTVL